MNQTLRHLILGILACALLLSCDQSGQPDNALRVRPDPRHSGRYVSQFPVMSTDATIIVAARDQDAAQEMIEKAAERIKRVDRLMSSYRDGSEVSRINKAGPNEDVEVSDMTLHVLQRAKEIADRTEGAFDITYAPLRSLWRRAREEEKRPSEATIEKRLSLVGSQHITSSDNHARLDREGMEIDLGGIAKGFAIDEAIRALRGADASSALVDIGGDMRVLGRRPDGDKWNVKMRDPRPGKHDPIRLRLEDSAVATSGDYVRYFRIKDRKYSHIIDPRTGQPARMVPSATVIAPRAIRADALATALSVMDAEEALNLINSLDDVECLIMTRQDPRTSDSVQLHNSDGFFSRVEQ